MKKTIFWLLLAFTLLSVVAACAPNNPMAPASSPFTHSSSSGSDSVPVLNVYASGGVASLESIISNSGIPNEITYRGGAELVKEMNELDIENGPSIHAFILDSRYWLSQTENITDTVVITNSYTVALVEPELSVKMGWSFNSDLYTVDIKEAFDKKVVRLGVTSASSDGTALSFISSYLTAIKGNREPLILEDLTNPVIMDAVAQYAAALNNTAGNVSLLLQEEIYFREHGGTSSNLIILPENAAISFNLELIEKGLEPLDIHYIVDATSMQTYIYGCARDLSDELQAQCEALGDKLSSDEAKAEMLKMGYRVTEMGMALEGADLMAFHTAWGIRADEEFILATLPKNSVMLQIQSNWSEFYRPATSTAYIPDFSGSMEDCDDEETGKLKRCEKEDESRYDKLMRAMKLSFLGTGEYGMPIGEDDRTIIIPFSSSIGNTYSVLGNKAEDLAELYSWLENNNSPGGGTAIYEAVWEGLRQLHVGRSTSEFTSIILLTDGENGGNLTIDAFLKKYRDAGYATPIYVIAIGGADDNELKLLAEKTNGDFCDGRGDIEQQNHCFLKFRSN